MVCPNYVITLNIVICCPIGDEMVGVGEGSAKCYAAKKNKAKELPKRKLSFMSSKVWIWILECRASSQA